MNKDVENSKREKENCSNRIVRKLRMINEYVRSV